MSKMNHARLALRGRLADPIYKNKKKTTWHPNQAAKGGAVTTLSAEARAAWAAENGYAVART